MNKMVVEDILARICANKREEVAARKVSMPLDELKAAVRNVDKPRGFGRALMDALIFWPPKMVFFANQPEVSGLNFGTDRPMTRPQVNWSLPHNGQEFPPQAEPATYRT